MSIVPMKSLLESGVHFGHRTHKWHPAMKQFIFTERNSIHIIDLQKTVKALEAAYNLVRDTVSEDGTVLFVGTKRQAQETILDEATRVGMPYVTARWLGGMLTNWRTIRQRLNELERLERMRDQGDFERLTKKEGLILQRKIDRLEMLLGGIRHMNTLPNLLFVVDVRREDTAIHEANLLKIPVIAMVDTNCDPSKVDYVIPSNDDAIRAIKLLVGKIADACQEGLALRKETLEEEMPPVAISMTDIEEEELSDEELLGAATLAKISSSTRPSDDEPEDEDEIIIETEGETGDEGEAILVEGAVELEVVESSPEPEDVELDEETEVIVQEPVDEVIEIIVEEEIESLEGDIEDEIEAVENTEEEIEIVDDSDKLIIEDNGEEDQP